MNKFTATEEADALLLVRLTEDGHNGAFDALARKFSDWVIAAAYSVLRDHHDAQDAAQEAWVGIWKDCQKGGLREIVSVPGLLYMRGKQAAVALCIRRRAVKRGGRDRGLFDYDLLRELHGTYRWRKGGSEQDMTERTPEEDPAKNMGLVHRLAVQLPAEHLAALDAFYFKNESLTALAERLRVSVTHANRLLCHGVQLLRHMAEEITPAEYAAVEFEEVAA